MKQTARKCQPGIGPRKNPSGYRILQTARRVTPGIAPRKIVGSYRSLAPVNVDVDTQDSDSDTSSTSSSAPGGILWLYIALIIKCMILFGVEIF